MENLNWTLILIMILGNSLLVYYAYNQGKNYVDLGLDCDIPKDCWDGCIYAEWLKYGYKNLSGQSQRYDNCATACWEGEEYFKS